MDERSDDENFVRPRPIDQDDFRASRGVYGALASWGVRAPFETIVVALCLASMAVFAYLSFETPPTPMVWFVVAANAIIASILAWRHSVRQQFRDSEAKKGRPRRETPYVRLSLEIHPDVEARIKNIQNAIHADTRAEVLRRSLALFELLQAETADGAKLVLEYPDHRDSVTVQLI